MSLLDRAAAGEEVSITRHGKVVAVLISPDALSCRRAAATWEGAEQIARLLEEAGQQPIPDRGLAPGRPDELVAEFRRDRQARPWRSVRSTATS